MSAASDELLAFLRRLRAVREYTSEPVSQETIEAMIVANDELVQHLQEARKPVYILSDFSRIGKHTVDSRVALERYLATRFFDKIAAFGLPGSLQITAWMLLNISGKADKVKVFKTEEEARAWLKEA